MAQFKSLKFLSPDFLSTLFGIESSVVPCDFDLRKKSAQGVKALLIWQKRKEYK